MKEWAFNLFNLKIKNKFQTYDHAKHCLYFSESFYRLSLTKRFSFGVSSLSALPLLFERVFPSLRYISKYSAIQIQKNVVSNCKTQKKSNTDHIFLKYLITFHDSYKGIFSDRNDINRWFFDPLRISLMKRFLWY